MTDLKDLARRVSELKGPDREVDAEIAVCLKHGCRTNLADDLEYLSLPNKADPGPGVAAGHYWLHCRSGMSLRSAPAFTASLDAAMMLVPEGAKLTFLNHGDTGGRSMWLVSPNERFISAATPALALTAAALIARSSQ